MAVTLDQFRGKVASGTAARIELDTLGTGLHRKGLTAGGKVVEWIREGLGLRSAENQRTLKAFVGALKAEYGTTISGIAEAGLMRDLVNGVKPLSARHCRQVLSDAETLRSTNAEK